MPDTQPAEPGPDDLEELVLACLETAEPRAELERRTAGDPQRFAAALQLLQQVQRLERTQPDQRAGPRDPDPTDRSTWPPIPAVTLEALIGRGGQGFVFRGRQTYLERVVAVKVLAAAWHSPAFLVRFQREARTLAGLQHPHIVTCHHAGLTERGECYLAMEFVAGPTLEAWLAEHGKMPLEAALRLAIAIACALEHARQFGFVHRDVKPGNVLLAPKPQAAPNDPFPFVPKLADLGLARPVASGRGFTALTPVGAMIGTPLTMAPEQFDDPEHVDQRADIYGLGCVLHHALAGRPAFAGRAMTDLLAQKMAMRGAGIRVYLPGVPAPVAALVARMIACDREDRPQSYAELLAELEALLPAPAASRRNRWSMLLVAGVLLGTAAAGMLFLRNGATAPEPGMVVAAPHEAIEGAPVHLRVQPDPRAAVLRSGDVRKLFGTGDEVMAVWTCSGQGTWADESGDGALVVDSTRGTSDATCTLPRGAFWLQGRIEPRRCWDAGAGQSVPIVATGCRVLFGGADRLTLDVTPAPATAPAEPDRFRAVLRRQRLMPTGTWEQVGDVLGDTTWVSSERDPLLLDLRWSGKQLECSVGAKSATKATSITATPTAEWQVEWQPGSLTLYADRAVAAFTNWNLSAIE